MIKISTLILLILCAAAGSVTGAAPVKPMQFGVTGHPYVQEGYREIPLSVQLDLVADLGLKWYRTDWFHEIATKNPAEYDKLINEARRRGITILPIIFPPINCRSEASLEEIRASSFKFAKDLAARYKGKITYWELDNELDLFTMIQKGEVDRNGVEWLYGAGDGSVPEQFYDGRYQKALAELRGLHEGIKAGNPKAKTMVNYGGWLHHGFLTRLIKEDKLPFDIIGLHWYSEMGDMTKVKGNIDVPSILKGFGKPIWITEINRRGGSIGDGGEQEQSKYVTSVVKQMKGIKGIEAFFLYELLDEPYFGADNPESHFGLVEIKKGSDNKWLVGRKKEAYGVYKNLVTIKPKPAVKK
ncbi:MAG: glycosyl hydrolase [Armatimonadota bacterium]